DHRSGRSSALKRPHAMPQDGPEYDIRAARVTFSKAIVSLVPSHPGVARVTRSEAPQTRSRQGCCPSTRGADPCTRDTFEVNRAALSRRGSMCAATLQRKLEQADLRSQRSKLG